MNDQKKKMEPWQLVLIVVLVAAFYGGLWVMYQALEVRLDKIENAVTGQADRTRMALDRVETKVKNAAERASKADQKPAADPAPTEAAVTPGDAAGDGEPAAEEKKIE